MQYIINLALGAFLTGTITTSTATIIPISAAIQKSPNYLTMSISNDDTGINGAATVPLNAGPQPFSKLFHGTAIDQDGKMMGTSAWLHEFPPETICNITNNKHVYHINALSPAVGLDGEPSMLKPVNLKGATISCSAKRV